MCKLITKLALVLPYFVFCWLLSTLVSFFHESLLIQVWLCKLVLPYSQKYFLRCHRYGSFDAKWLPCLFCALVAQPDVVLPSPWGREGWGLLSLSCLESSLPGLRLAVGMAGCHWERWGALKDKQLATGERMALSGWWRHQFTTKRRLWVGWRRGLKKLLLSKTRSLC